MKKSKLNLGLLIVSGVLCVFSVALFVLELFVESAPILHKVMFGVHALFCLTLMIIQIVKIVTYKRTEDNEK